MKRTHGMVLGKFLPPHRGHQYLIETANKLVDDLTVVVGTLENEPISGVVRYEWLKELCSRDIKVIHLNKDLPQYPEEHTDFWGIWKTELENILPRKVDSVFASENYGWRLAKELDAEFSPIDIGRSVIPISATQIRKSPIENFEYIARPAKPYFTKRVCIIGPESTGKSTLVKKIAKFFSTIYVPEYARSLIEAKNGEIEKSDMLPIAKIQIACEETLAKDSNGLLICDTDILTTQIWSQHLFGYIDPELIDLAKRDYDLTILLDADVQWVPDIVRFTPENREEFHQKFIDALELQGRQFVRVNGSWDNRFEKTCHAIKNCFAL